MRSFNCLSLDCPIWGNHLLEASAGTGKTFAIEHIVTRMILDGLAIEKILIVTFTKAATRELKKRIRANLKKALHALEEGEGIWDYLKSFIHSQEAKERLTFALSHFDLAQIFTIHGFCYRILQEFAFEAKFHSADPEEESFFLRAQLRDKAKYFLETSLDPKILCPEQLSFLLKEYGDMGAFASALMEPMEERESPSFQDLWTQYKKAILSWQKPLPPKEEFEALKPFYKSEIKGDFQGQLDALYDSFSSEKTSFFQYLIKCQGSLFHFLSPNNRKVKGTPPHSDFFTWAIATITPLIDLACDTQMLLTLIQRDWKPIETAFLEKEGWIDPDGILKKMKEALQEKEFIFQVKSKYQAVMIDEFQDTDATQWELFRTLFLQDTNLKALYLVGDPKQSIYRFRKADVYTYYQAKQLLGENALFSLDTNFRSTPELIEGLNALFARNWLFLPKTGHTIDCIPVKAGRTLQTSFEDGKGAIHFLEGSFESDFFEKTLLPFTISEIERLHSHVPLGNFAILVKDRYEAALALKICEERGFPAIAKTRLFLHETFAFRALQELFAYFLSPPDIKLQKIVALGPFKTLAEQESKELLEKKGLPVFCNTLLQCAPHEEFLNDLRQVIEELLIWESTHGFSLSKAAFFLSTFQFLHASEAKLKKASATKQEAIQIMTLHMSKGLEFDVVFALGLSSRSGNIQKEIEEFEAEKLRQLYVAMTRAKLRLYVPAFLSPKSARSGASSPIELFFRTFPIASLKNLPHITLETLEPIVLKPKPQTPAPCLTNENPSVFPYQTPSYLYSFSSLAPPRSESSKDELIQDPSLFTSYTIPKGSQTGTFIHALFESLFSSSEPIWQSEQKVKSWVQKKVSSSFLALWQEAAADMIWNTLAAPFQLGDDLFSLMQLEPEQIYSEMEFLFKESSHWIKGFIDLVFYHQGKYYFVDWKTNWLGDTKEHYQNPTSAMDAHHYWLQASIYHEALVKQLYNDRDQLGGAIYMFLRGQGAFHFIPKPFTQVAFS